VPRTPILAYIGVLPPSIVTILTRVFHLYPQFNTTPRASRYARTAHDKWLRIELVLDLSKVGAIIGIVHVECLEVINIYVATRNG
jgi:hypothetical protein